MALLRGDENGLYGIDLHNALLTVASKRSVCKTDLSTVWGEYLCVERLVGKRLEGGEPVRG